MLKFYLNRELSARLGIPLSRWKRWSREFLPPDPLGGLQSGYARQYSVKDSFSVYLAGYLVAVVGFSIPETRQILNDLNGWLKKNIITPYQAMATSEGDDWAAATKLELLIIPAEGRTSPAFTYRVRFLRERKFLSGGNMPLWQEQFTEQTLKPCKPSRGGCYPICARRVDISTVAQYFFQRLTAQSG
ncbi:MAG: hypothetical protein PVJ53_05095 [Desulfobacterales bacterium]|jgi:hypothetical protein